MQALLAHAGDNDYEFFGHMDGMMGGGAFGVITIVLFWLLLFTLMVLAVIWLLKDIQKKK